MANLIHDFFREKGNDKDARSRMSKSHRANGKSEGYYLQRKFLDEKTALDKTDCKSFNANYNPFRVALSFICDSLFCVCLNDYIFSFFYYTTLVIVNH